MSTTPPASDDDAGSPQQRRSLIGLFLAFQIIGLIGSIALVLTTTLSRRASRSATWQNFFTSWIVSAISYSLLLFTSQAYNDTPPFGVCLAQAGLIYAMPSFTAATTFGLITQIWFTMQSLLKRRIASERYWVIALIIIPYCFLVAMATASWATGSADPASVGLIGSGMYCHIDAASGKLGKISGALVALILLPTVAIEISICVALRQHWKTFRRVRHSFSIMIRVMVFTLIGLLAVSIGALFVFSSNHGPAMNIVLAAMPFVSAVIFASQRDIISVWMFWRPSPSDQTLSETSTSTTNSTAALVKA
ncbi:unnamed protein product [Mycena citricolor]|uniref:Uncharacterized protein n=1 Tax=Mycena citricolor TaxID=2018698 RepID=A0AAD2HV08_9AGAR|nr:unnamed protein product [Mycena citricolor]